MKLMNAISDITIDQLVQACKNLSPSGKIELLERLPKNWLADVAYQLTDAQMRALDAASAKEAQGESIWHTWDEVKGFVKEDKR